MKRVISLILSVALLLSVMPCFAASEEGKVVFYDDFETDLSKWEYASDLSNEANVKLTGEKVKDGKQSICITDELTDGAVGIKTQMFPATPGTVYTIYADIYHDGGKGGNAYINFFNAEKKKIGNKSASAKNDFWASTKTQIVSPEGTAFIQILVVGGAAATGKSYVDYIKVTEGEEFFVALGEKASSVVIPANANNGDLIFSEDFVNLGVWKPMNTKSTEFFSINKEYYSKGAESVKLTIEEPTETTHALKIGKYPIDPDSEYTLFLDTFILSGTPLTPIVRVYDEADKRLLNHQHICKTGGWNENVISFSTPSAATSFEIYLYIKNGVSGEAYIDNLRLYKGKVASTADFSNAKAPDISSLEFKFKSPYEMPDFKPTIGHPRVYFNKDDIETIKANASHPQNASAFERLKTEIASTSDGSVAHLSGDNLDDKIMGIIQAKAFYYAVWGDEQKGKEAISMLNNFLKDANPYASEYNSQGYMVFTIAAVYDWCYPLLTDTDKKLFQYKGMETGSTMEVGFPPVKDSVFNSHGAEAQLLRDQMSFAIAVYDERPDIYQAIAGRFFEESIDSVKFLAQAKSSMFGNSYSTYRYQWEAVSLFMMDALGLPNIFGEDHKAVLYWMLYARRPDGSVIRDGDSVSNNQNPVMYDERGTRTFFLAGNYYKDPYIKGEALRHNNGLIIGENTGNNSLSSIEVLCFNDPSVGYKSTKELPLSMYYPAPRGEMLARTSWAEGEGSPAVIAQMKVDEYWTQGHDHLDSGEFEIFYKGALANDTGYYQAGRSGSTVENSGNTVFGTVHFYNYQRRTIAHNCMIVFDPNEDKQASYKGHENDGGQIFANNETDITTIQNLNEEKSHVGKVLGHEIGTDTVQPDYTYLKGDIAKAYGEKVPEYERSFMFLNLKNSDTPAAMVVFDRVKAKDASFDKKWILHGLKSPEINGTRTIFKDTRTGYNGKLTVDTLLPKAENLDIKSVGGKNEEFLVNGVNYHAQTLAGKINEGGGCRIEVSPKADAEEDYFLNVLQVADANSKAEPLNSEMIESATHTGVKIADRVVMFGKLKDRVTNDVSFTVNGEGWFKYTVADLKEGTWKVIKDGADLCEIVATKDGGLGSFEAGAGSFTLSYLGAYGEKAFTTTPMPYTEGINLKMEPGNNYIYSDVDPFTVNGRTLIPLRAIFEALGANVSWDEATATATGEKNGTVIKITENSEIAYVNGAEYKLDAPAIIKDGRFVVPVRFVAESFGVKVDWDDFSKTVIINTTISSLPGNNVFNDTFDATGDIADALPVYKLEQSGDNGTGENISLAFDGYLHTKWGVKKDEKGNPCWGVFDLGSSKTIDAINIAFMAGTKRVYNFSIYVSEDGSNYTPVKENIKSSGKTDDFERFDLGGVKGRFVKYVGFDNSVNEWNSIYEIVISGK